MQEGPPDWTHPTRAIYLGYVDQSVTEEKLHDEFSRFGEIEFVRLLQKNTCAFVNFLTELAATAALKACIANEVAVSAGRFNYAKVQCRNKREMDYFLALSLSLSLLNLTRDMLSFNLC
jgi:hypothetical protein